MLAGVNMGTSVNCVLGEWVWASGNMDTTYIHAILRMCLYSVFILNCICLFFKAILICICCDLLNKPNILDGEYVFSNRVAHIRVFALSITIFHKYTCIYI